MTLGRRIRYWSSLNVKKESNVKNSGGVSKLHPRPQMS